MLLACCVFCCHRCIKVQYCYELLQTSSITYELILELKALRPRYASYAFFTEKKRKPLQVNFGIPPSGKLFIIYYCKIT
jgi:hypothetical protein